MADRGPQRRKPIREPSLNEINDNLRNNAAVTRSQSKKVLQTPLRYKANDKEVIVLQDHDTLQDYHVPKNFYDKFNGFTEKIKKEDVLKGRIRINLEDYKLVVISMENLYVPKIEYLINDHKKVVWLSNGINQDDTDSTYLEYSNQVIDDHRVITNSAKKSICNNSIKKDKTLKNTEDKVPQKSFLRIWILVFAAVGLLSFFVFNLLLSQKNMLFKDGITSDFELNDTLENVKMSLKNMRRNFPNQDPDLWHQVFASLASILRNPTKPSIIVLVGKSQYPLNCFTVMLSNISEKALKTETLLLVSKNFAYDTGNVIESLKPMIQGKKSVVIWDLLNINIEALKAFHSFCDRENPLVKNVLFIITIIDEELNEESPLKFIENHMKKRLTGKMDLDSIDPLITRITDGPVINIKTESINVCPVPLPEKIL